MNYKSKFTPEEEASALAARREDWAKSEAANPMNDAKDKCPKCGAKMVARNLYYILFDCNSSEARQGDLPFLETEDCKRRAELTTLKELNQKLTAERDELSRQRDCWHPKVYFNAESDNYYCESCTAGMGTAYFILARERDNLQRRIENIISTYEAHDVHVEDCGRRGAESDACLERAINEAKSHLAKGEKTE